MGLVETKLSLADLSLRVSKAGGVAYRGITVARRKVPSAALRALWKFAISPGRVRPHAPRVGGIGPLPAFYEVKRSGLSLLKTDESSAVAVGRRAVMHACHPTGAPQSRARPAFSAPRSDESPLFLPSSASRSPVMLSPSTVTLEDVARAARVHRSTVALALRDHPRISADTRKRVKALAENLGYKVNPLVAALMRNRRSGIPIRREAIAYVTSHPTRYGWRPEHHNRPDFFPGAHQRAHDFGYDLEHLWFAEPGMTPKRFQQVLMSRSIRGLIIGRMPPGKLSLDLEWDTFPAVALGMTLQSPRLHHVTENHFDTAWLAMQQCQARGYRRVGFVFSEANDSPCVGDRWLGAYVTKQMQYSQSDRMLPCPGAPTDEKKFIAWFQEHRPDALLVTHSAPVLRWLAAMGCNVPKDVGLVELQDNIEGNVAGVCYDRSRIGALAIELLVDLIYRNETGIPLEQHEILLSGKWREGLTLPSRLINSPHEQETVEVQISRT